MAKVKVSAGPVKAGKRPNTVKPVTVTTESGSKKRVMSVSANSASFGSDFLYVFKKNVKAARSANKEAVGAHEGVKNKR